MKIFVSLIFLFCFAAAANLVFAQTPPWPQSRHDATHQGRSDSKGAENGTVKWSISLDQNPHALVATSHRIYVGAREISALREDGTVAWTFERDSGTGVYYVDLAFSGPESAIYASHEDVIETNPVLVSLQTNGEVNWRRHFADTSGVSINAAVYYCSDNRIVALSPEGHELWRKPGCTTDIAVSKNGIIYSVDHDLSGKSKLFGLRKDGSVAVRAVISTSSDEYFSSPAAAQGMVVVSSSTGTLFAFHPNGSLLWKRKFDGVVSPASINAEGVIYVGTPQGLVALNPNGSKKWTASIGNASYSVPAIDRDGTIFESSANQQLYSISPDGKVNWKVHVIGTPDSPIIGPGNTTIVSAWDNSGRTTLYAIQ